MTRPTLDQRIEAARKKADATICATTSSFEVVDGRVRTVVQMCPIWLTVFATALEASAERGVSIEELGEKLRAVEVPLRQRIAELERERDVARDSSTQYAVLAGQRAAKVDDLTAQLTALTASVSAAKRLTDALAKRIGSGRRDFEGKVLSIDFETPLDASRAHHELTNGLIPAPVPPSAPERVSGLPVLIPVDYDEQVALVAITPERAKRIVALAGGAE